MQSDRPGERRHASKDEAVQPFAKQRPLIIKERLRTLKWRIPVERGIHKATARPSFFGRHRRSEEHTSELQSLMRISYAVFCLKKKTTIKRLKCKSTTMQKYTKKHRRK